MKNEIAKIRKELLVNEETELHLPDGTTEIYTFHGNEARGIRNEERYTVARYAADGTLVEQKCGYVFDWGWDRITDNEWDDATPTNSRCIGAVREGKKWFLVWADSCERIDDQHYDELTGPFEGEDCFSFMKSEWGPGRGLINERGKVVFMPIYDTMPIPLEDKTFLAKKDGQIGIINRRGETIVPFGEYKPSAMKPKSDILTRDGNIRKIYSREGVGLTNHDGRDLIPVVYEHLDLLQCGNDELFVAVLDGMWGVINVKNEVVVPFDFDQIDRMPRYGDRITVLKNGKWREVALGEIRMK